MGTEPHLIRIPKLYENMDEATIGEWFIDEGQPVSVGDDLVELVTDKTTESVESSVEGVVLKHYVPEKSVVPVGFIIACIGPEGAEVPDVAAENKARLGDDDAEPEPPPTSESKDMPAKPRIRVAPAARVFAKKNGVDLDDVAKSTGAKVIHKKDVEAFLAGQTAPEPEASSESPTGRVALITGASGDIGQAIARKLARQGLSLALHFHRNRECIDQLMDELTPLGVEIKAYSADLTVSTAATKLVDDVYADFSKIDVLVNNAGCLNDGLLSFMTDDQWHSVMKLNLDSAFYVSRAAAMQMARSRSGCIINISSAAAKLGSAGRSNYAAAKAGLLGFTRSAARELAGSNIQVNAVCPGFIESGMTEGFNDKRRKDIMREIPSRRFGTTEEVADVIGFLASGSATYITGQAISVDGGLAMG